jgi:arsenate reductase (glutaredoxin)
VLNSQVYLYGMATTPYTLYAIPNCDTVKKARTWLAEHGVAYQFHDYKKQGIDRATLDRWLTQRTWEDLVNRAGTTWKQLPGADKPTNAEAAIALMLAKPSVIRRPLIEANGKVIALGFKADEYLTTFGPLNG